MRRSAAGRGDRSRTRCVDRGRWRRADPWRDHVCGRCSTRPASSCTPISGRAPLSARPRGGAGTSASGYVDVEFDLATGTRARRGVAARWRALRAAVPAAEEALVVNNGAAALVLATTALAAGREVVVSRGEMVEIGDGFRLPDLIASTGARLREVGTTNRTPLARLRATRIGPDTGCVLKVHPSNFRVQGFTAAVAGGSSWPPSAFRWSSTSAAGCSRRDPLLPDEPDADTALRAGADVVTASGDKLLGGPQAGLVLGPAPTSWRGCAGIRWPAPCGRTS